MEKDVIEIWASSDEEEVEQRHRSSFVSYFPKGKGIFAIKDEFKKKKEVQNREFDEDCFILDYDPFDSLKKLSINGNEENEEDADDLSVIAERGQVACRDFPHSRHLCVKFPFRTTPHSSHCEKCYCYVCDSIAPCKFWSDGPQEHCHATADDLKWKVLRDAGKPISSTQGNLLGQLLMNIATAQRHDSYLSDQNISVNQPTTRDDRFHYDSRRDNSSSQDMGSCGEGTNTFRCFNPRDHWPHECPSVTGAGRCSVPMFNGGRAGNRNEERYINDRNKNHHRTSPFGGQYRGGYTHGNRDHCYAGDRCQPAGGQYGGDYTHENHDHRYAADQCPPDGSQFRGVHTNRNHDRHYARDRCPPDGGQFKGGSRYFPDEGRFERGDRYGGGGAWDQNHYNGYGNDKAYDMEGGHNGASNTWEWRGYDNEGAWDQNHYNGYGNDKAYDMEGGHNGASNTWEWRGYDNEGTWDQNHYNGYGNDKAYDMEGGHNGASNTWEWRGYDNEGNHDRRYVEYSCPPTGGQCRGGSRCSPTQCRCEGGDRYGGGAWDRNHHNGYGNGRGYDKEGGHKRDGNIWEWRTEEDW